VRNYIGRMVSIMSDLYRKADGVLEEMDKLSEDASKDQLKSLKKSIVDTDFIKRECAETYGKIEQANKNFEHKEKAYMKGKFTGDADALVKALNIENAFEELKCDADYLLPLWRDVLIKNLENLTSAVKSRIAFQESLEVKKEQKEVRLLRHITILSLAAAVIKLGSTPTFKLKDLAIYSVLAVLLSALVLFIVEYYSGALSIARKRREQ
jgi:hypothetical protein